MRATLKVLAVVSVIGSGSALAGAVGGSYSCHHDTYEACKEFIKSSSQDSCINKSEIPGGSLTAGSKDWCSYTKK